MKRLAIALLLAVAGCHVHGSAHHHPHGGPPGQVKKSVYRCGPCGSTKGSADFCHGKLMIQVP